MSAEPRREVTGAIVRGLSRALETRGLKDKVSAIVGSEAKELLSHPPLHFTWVPAAGYEELLAAAAKVVGTGSERKLGHDLVAEGVGPVIRPLLKTVMALMGGGPAGILKGLSRAVPMQYRGLAFTYRELGPREGELTIDYGAPVDPLCFKVWEGCLEFGTDVHGVPTQNVLREVSPDQHRGVFRITW